MFHPFKSGGGRLAVLFFTTALLFALLYHNTYLRGVDAENTNDGPSELETWTEETSAGNGLPLTENKDVYKEGVDANLYDVYLNVFPTRDENGKILSFGDFALHSARNHDYNPVLNCRIQIQPEGEAPDPITDSDAPNATIRVRGNSARGDEYKSYKVTMMDKAVPFKGQTVLNINKHSEDDVKVVTKLCTDILRDVPNMVTYQTYFMRVWVKDESLPRSEQKYVYQGLYTSTEQPNKTFLRKRGLSPNCSMYKARDFSFKIQDHLLNVDDPMYDERLFEQVLGIRESKDHSKILEMITAVGDRQRSFEEIFEEYFNEENYLTWLAFSILTGGDDILNHNFILYTPANTQTWYFLPWDFDANLQVHSGYRMTPSLAAGQKLNMVPLHRRYFRTEDGLRKLDLKMQELLAGPLSEENMDRLLEQYMPVLEKTMTKMPDVTLTKYAPSELEEEVFRLPQLVQENYQSFLYAFQFPSPMFVEMPVVRPDGGLTFSWEPSFSHQKLPIAYSVRVYSDCMKKNLLFKQENLQGTRLETDLRLSEGVYYVDVRAVDSEGREQLSLEHYEKAGLNFIYQDGLLEFTVGESGGQP